MGGGKPKQAVSASIHIGLQVSVHGMGRLVATTDAGASSAGRPPTWRAVGLHVLYGGRQHCFNRVMIHILGDWPCADPSLLLLLFLWVAGRHELFHARWAPLITGSEQRGWPIGHSGCCGVGSSLGQGSDTIKGTMSEPILQAPKCGSCWALYAGSCMSTESHFPVGFTVHTPASAHTEGEPMPRRQMATPAGAKTILLVAIQGAVDY